MAKRSRGTPYLGVDLGGTNIQAGIVRDNHVVERDSVKTRAADGADAVIDRIVKLCTGLADAHGIGLDDVAAAGIGAPGAINVETRTVSLAVNLGWRDVPLGKLLEKRLGLPVTVDNDVNVGVWGERAAGAARGFDDVLGIFVGTGIGGGLVLDGKIVHGRFMTGGEIGHTVMRADAPLGRRTLEDLAPRTNIVRHLLHLIDTGHPSELLDIADGDRERIRSKVLSKALQRKDALTLEVVRDAAHYVGVAAANAVTLLSLPCVVIGGGLTEACGPAWIKAIREGFNTHVFPPHLADDVKLVASTLGDDAGVLGAADLARSEADGRR